MLPTLRDTWGNHTQVFQSTALLSNTSLLHWYAVAMETPVPHLTLSDMMPPPPPHFNQCGKVVSPRCSNYEHRFVLTSSLVCVNEWGNICIFFVYSDGNDNKPWIKSRVASSTWGLAIDLFLLFSVCWALRASNDWRPAWQRPPCLLRRVSSLWLMSSAMRPRRVYHL